MQKSPYSQLKYDLIDAYNHCMNTEQFSNEIDRVIKIYDRTIRQRLITHQTHEDCSELEHLLELK